MDEIIKKRKIYKKSIFLVVFLALLFSFYWFVSGRDQVRNYNIDSSRLTFSKAGLGKFEETIPIYGTIVPLKTVYLDTIRGGIVEEIYIEEGDNVEQGTPLLKFRNLDFKLHVYSQEARISEQLDINSNTRLSLDKNRLEIKRELNEIELNISLSKRELARLSKLSEQGYVAREEHLDAQDRYNFLVKSKEINLEALKQDEALRERKIAQLTESAERLNEHMKAIRESLQQLIVKAPVSGQVTSLPIEIGESKTISERIGQIDVFGGYMVVAYVDSFYLSRIEVGQLAQFAYSNNDLMLKIKKVYPEIKDGKFKLDLSFESAPPKDILRGQNVNLELKLGQRQETLLVEKGGFLQDTGGNWVFVVSKDGELAEKRNVKLGRKNSKFVEVLSGIEKGDVIVTSSYANFLDMNQLSIR